MTTPVPPRLDSQLCFAVYSTALAFNRAYRPLLARLGLTYPQYLVMMILWDCGGQTVSSISEKLFLDSGTTTPLLKRLEAAGLLRRTRDTTDERRVLVELTAKGQALQAEAAAIPRAITARIAGVAAGAGDLHAQLLAIREQLLAAPDPSA